MSGKARSSWCSSGRCSPSSGVLTSPVDAFFESVAAITTTGLSCLDYARSDMARSLVLWHSIMNWLGGLNFIIILSTVLPQVSGCFGLTLSARQSIFFSPVWNKMAESARQGFGVYTALTGLSFVLYLLAGLDSFAALTRVTSSPMTASRWSSRPASRCCSRASIRCSAGRSGTG